MSEDVKIIAIGPDTGKLISIMERLAKEAGVTLIDFQQAFERATNQLQKVNELNEININELATAFNHLKSAHEFDKPKSKYINKPQRNYRKRY
ncbi:hypothetical protein [Flavobacterium lipolyticum]|uniref:Uncharacterized protein n=1 Tax=Flavobacterium lipolyticum TaxID=2893754 RepID=A0ABS8LWJ0_9FLAO|nr:hypothetical protein [Flavobacterium sp. F-126]MCC9016950.1 hypothetical protein [Flavobacterium sp. F-126]